jgi:hypothetical protein
MKLLITKLAQTVPRGRKHGFINPALDIQDLGCGAKERRKYIGRYIHRFKDVISDTMMADLP